MKYFAKFQRNSVILFEILHKVHKLLKIKFKETSQAFLAQFKTILVRFISTMLTVQ